MPINEKEYNGILFDQVSILDRIERVARRTNATEVLEEIEFERSQINRKLYQEPPLIDDGNN